MKIVADNNIPYLKGVLEPFTDVEYIEGKKISHEHLIDADALITRTRTTCNEKLLKGIRDPSHDREPVSAGPRHSRHRVSHRRRHRHEARHDTGSASAGSRWDFLCFARGDRRRSLRLASGRPDQAGDHTAGSGRKRRADGANG